MGVGLGANSYTYNSWAWLHGVDVTIKLGDNLQGLNEQKDEVAVR